MLFVVHGGERGTKYAAVQLTLKNGVFPCLRKLLQKNGGRAVQLKIHRYKPKLEIPSLPLDSKKLNNGNMLWNC